MASWDVDGYCRTASSGHREWFGLEPDQAVGLHLREVLGERLFEAHRQPFAAALAGQEEVLVTSVLDRAGRERHVEVTYLPDRGPDGRVRGAFAHTVDATSRVWARRDLEADNEQLADTIAMLGHDVRQPLTAVLGFLDEAIDALRAEDGDAASSDAMVRACVDKAGRAGTRMRRLLDDILSVASVDAGTLVARPERVGLAELLGAVAEEVTSEVTVTGAEGVVVRADLFHLRQALTNLLVNATKYGRPPFEVSVRRDGDRVELSVDDHGDGVPAEFVPALFERFSRGAGLARGDGGSAGLGLHLVRSLVEVNGGTVRYAGLPGGGARFVVSLPPA